MDLYDGSVYVYIIFLSPILLLAISEKVCKRAVDIMVYVAQYKDIVFELIIPERIGVVYGDESRLSQVILNLLSNAFKVLIVRMMIVRVVMMMMMIAEQDF